MPENIRKSVVTIGGWLLGLIWALPILYALWAAFHPSAYTTNFDLTAP